jgi:hypothetical protein
MGVGLPAASFEGPVAVVGDIHGSIDLLRQLLARLGSMPVVVVGDLCDRGRDTPAVLDLLIARGAERYWVTHAGVPRLEAYPEIPRGQLVPWLAQHQPQELIWGWNAPPPARMPPLDRTVLMGHVTHEEPLDTGAVIALDTGAGSPGGRLTAVILPARTFITVASP